MVTAEIIKSGRITKELRHHSYLYYVLDKPEITDFEFDACIGHLWIWKRIP
ncbi:MAG: DNA ligase LigA-related protein [Dialister invisus]